MNLLINYLEAQVGVRSLILDYVEFRSVYDDLYPSKSNYSILRLDSFAIDNKHVDIKLISFPHNAYDDKIVGHFSFPTAHLVEEDPNKVADAIKKEVRKRHDRQVKATIVNEQSERAQLRALLAKYPEEVGS